MEPADTQPPTEADLPDLVPENGTRRSMLVRVALGLGAAVCFGLGLVLWPVPVMTGIPFWILGFVLLGMVSRRTARWVNRQERRLPRRARLLLRPRLRRALRKAQRT